MLSGSRQLTTAVMVGEAQADAAALAIIPAVRRSLIPAPSRGPLADDYGQAPLRGYVPSLGGHTIVLGEQGRGAPMLPPSPAPSPAARGYVPQTYTNPGHVLFPLQGQQGRDARTPLAEPPRGEQGAVPLRADWRRPGTIQHNPIQPGSG